MNKKVLSETIKESKHLPGIFHKITIFDNGKIAWAPCRKKNSELVTLYLK